MSPTLSLSRRDLIRFLAAAVPASRMLAWQQDPKFSTGVSVVNVLATVRDKKGAIVHDLTQDDFTIEEDNHPQTIRYFSKQTDLPLTLGLLIDTSGSQRKSLPAERDASYKFLEQVLREDKDKAFVIRFAREVELLQDLTSSRKDLENSLHDLESPVSGQGPQLQRPGSGGGGGGSQYPGGGGGGQRGGQGFGGGTALYDAVFLTGDDVVKNQQGRKAAILLTDGVDRGSKVSINSAIETAQRADTLIYSIYFKGTEGSTNSGFPPNIGGLGGGRRGGGRGGGGRGGGGQMPGGGQRTNPADGKKVLQRFAQETGGGYYEVSGKQPLEKIYKNIDEELRNQYSIGYTSDGSGAGYRKIVVSVKKKGLIVHTRDGYYATA